jgi:serine phosphatase RsbU (regulator of sigma subunit)
MTMFDRSAGAGGVSAGTTERALSPGEATAVLRRCDFFAATSDSAVSALSAVAELVHLSGGSRLFEKGDAGTAIYFVLDGTVRVHQGEVVVGYLTAGEVFGEVAGLSNEPRSASVTAESDARLLKLEQAAVYSVLAAHPGAARSLIQALCVRERQIIDEKFDRIVRTRLLEHELEIGQKIQRYFLPEVLPEIAGWSIEGLLKPARQVAGDFYDFFTLPGLHRVGVVIGDVCDKGVGAALFMTLFRSLLRSAALRRCPAGGEERPPDPAEVLRHALDSTNSYIVTTHSNSSMFASVFFGLLDPRTGELHYANAGHEAPVIVGGDGIRCRLESTGPVVGLFEGARHGVDVASILPGEMLYGYTDGATDAKNALAEQFSEARLLETVGREADVGAEVLPQVLAEIEAFVGSVDQYDDITMICARRQSTPGPSGPLEG